MRPWIIVVACLLGACSIDVDAPPLVDENNPLTPDSGNPTPADIGTVADAGVRDQGSVRDGGTTDPVDSGPEPQDAGPVDPADDHGDTPDEATDLDGLPFADGALEQGGDVDFFRFRTTQRGIYRIGTQGNTDTQCALFDEADEELNADDDSGPGWNCQMEEELEADTFYWVRVKAWAGETGGYRLVIEGPLARCGDGQIGPGEDCDDGNEIGGDGCDRFCQDEVVPRGCEAVPGRGRATMVCWNPARTWPEARVACDDWGGFLATITDRRDHERFPAFVARRGSLWIGLNDLEEEDAWTWVGRSSAYRNWAPGEPNDWGGNEDCGMLRREVGGLWNDQGCQANLGYICER